MAPGADVFKPEGLAAQILPFGGQLQGAVKQRALHRVGDPAPDLCALGLPAEAQADRQRSGGVVLRQPRLEPQVLQVHPGLGIQEYRAEKAGKPEKVLILDPGRAGALVHLHAQAVARLPDIRGQIEVRRGEAVLGVPHEIPVEPDVNGLLRPLEADAHPLSPQAGGKVKFPDIASHGVVVQIHLGRAQLGTPVPGVEGVGIVDLPVALGFHVPRHQDCAEGGIIESLPPELRRTGGGAGAPHKPPHPVQGLAQGSISPGQLLGGGITHMV